MPARIYALAKELNIDSKDLVDLVKKVGITGKGSALASLSDDEAQKVRDHLAGATTTAPPLAPAVTAAPAAVRDAVPKERKPIAIKVGRSSRPAAKEPTPGPVARPAPKPAEPPVETPPDVPAPPVVPDSAPAQPVAKKGSLGSRIKSRMGARHSQDPVAPVRRDTTVGSGGKMRSLDRPSGGAEKKSADAGKGKRREPRINVKMASLPDVAEQAPSKPAAGEPKRKNRTSSSAPM